MKKSIALKIVWIGGFVLFGYSIFLLLSGVWGFGKFPFGKIVGGFFLMVIGLMIAFYGLKAAARNKLSLKVDEEQPKFLKSIGFNEDIKAEINYYRTFILDYNNHRVFATPIFKNTKSIEFNSSCIFDLNNMIDVAIRENHKTISKTEGGMGGALIGGALFGIAGAIIGSNMTKKTTTTKEITSLNVNIFTRITSDPIWRIKFIENPKEDGSVYHQLAKNAERVYSILRNWLITADERKSKKVILEKSGVKSERESSKLKIQAAEKIIAEDSVQELREYKKLLEDGIITPEEFELKKKQILNL